MTPFTITDWRRSLVALAFHISHLSQSNNLLGDNANDRGEYLFTDNGVPRPRPSTALAWASLCAFGPVQGFERPLENGQHLYHPFSLTSGRFLIPFLPKILFHEDMQSSLSRQNKSHARDKDGNIRWGNVYIADSNTGDILEQLPHGQRVAKEWSDSKPRGYILPTWRGQESIPPMYSESGEGWQFGIIQNLPNLLVTLRDPMLELAKRGIIETKYGGRDCPKIRRLLIRFLDVTAARAWASDYAESMASALNSDHVQSDILLLMKQIQEKRTTDDRVKDEKAKPKFKNIDDTFLTGLMAAIKESG